jgi:hypothetical protein
MSLIPVIVFALAACDGPNGNGTTTVVQKVAPTASPDGPQSAPSASASSAMTAIDDPKELCHQARVLSKKLFVVTNAYWKLAVNAHGKNVTDPDVAAAADKVSKAAGDLIPQLEGLVGPNAPSEVGGAVRDFTEAAKSFTNSIEEGGSNQEQSSLSSQYGHAWDKLDGICQAQ